MGLLEWSQGLSMKNKICHFTCSPLLVEWAEWISVLGVKGKRKHLVISLNTDFESSNYLRGSEEQYSGPALLTFDLCAKSWWPGLFQEGMGTNYVVWVCQHSGLRGQTVVEIMFLGLRIHLQTRESVVVPQLSWMSCMLSVVVYSINHRPIFPSLPRIPLELM